MKHDPVILGLAAEAVIFCAATALLVRATLAVGHLRQDLADAQEHLAHGHQAKGEAEGLEKTREELMRQEQETLRGVPLDEREPLECVKQLTLLALKAGAEHLSVAIQPRVLADAGRAQPPVVARPTMAPTSSPTHPDLTEPSRHPTQHGVAATTATAAQHLYAVPIRLDFDMEFTHVLELLDALPSAARVSTLEEISIDRLAGRSPRQQVTLTLRCYTSASR